ncbi:MAG: NAD(P)H-hydrate dehydratase [Desulfuromonadales bacterium]|nr:NAD(P)H-hydrate dehydratase [Desulfuromonadales bacterium]
MKLLSAAEMRELDRRTIEEIGLPGVVLMENAGRGAAELVRRRFAPLAPGPVLVLAGKGNNGGDGYVIARCLRQCGWQVRTVVLAPEEVITGDAAVHLQVLRRSGGEVVFTPTESALRAALEPARDSALLIDALLGTGLTSEVGGVYAVAIDWINRADRPVFAVDIPSGVDASTGAVLGRAVRADVTGTFAAAKLGHALHPGAALVGELTVVEIGIPVSMLEATGDTHLLFGSDEAAALLEPRPIAGHKGSFGHLLLVAGSVGKTGAAAMAAAGALRSGAGLVTVACPAPVQEVLAVKLTEAMTLALPAMDGAFAASAVDAVRRAWAGKQALALGPGLGQTGGAFALARQVIRECPLPLVIDADGLNALAEHLEILSQRSAPTILTPHPGEMARLTGQSVAAIEADRLGAARAFACEHGVTLVLKGARTITALPDGRIRINSSGHPGMASGGMGDVLTGIIGALLAQGMPAEMAAPLGVYLHGLAADRLLPALGDAGMVATDLLQELPATRRALIATKP